MKKIVYAFALFFTLNLMSCASSKSTSTSVVSNRISLSDYKYIVFGKDDDDNAAELADILMMVQNELSDKFVVLSQIEARALMAQGEKILSPLINVKSEKWGGGHTYISISFYDYSTNQSVAVVKSSGIGKSISQDQQLAFSAIRKGLNKVFK